MSRGERVMILSAGVGSGHNRAAEALRLACEARPDIEAVEVLDVLESSSALYRDVMSKGYFTLADGLPWVVEWGYDISDAPFRRRGPVDPWTRANALPALRRLRRFDPTVLICTHFLPAQLAASQLTHGSLRARTAVVTTDYDFQGLWLTSAFHRLSVARDEGRAQLTALGLPADRVNAPGIPVVPQLENDPGAETPVLLISAGAAGGDYALAVVRQTLHMRSAFRAVVVCGRNDELRGRMEDLTAAHRDRYDVRGYTTEMPQLMQRAALFVGKPGGLTASECMAAGLPMVLVNPIPGQEDRNVDFLLEEGAAVRCNTVSTIGFKIDGVLSEPGRLQRMRERARVAGRPHAARDVLEDILGASAHPLLITRAAQKTILQASGRHVVAADLTGPDALRHLVDAAGGSTLAVVRASEADDLAAVFGADGGPVMLRTDRLEGIRAGAAWERHQLVRRLLAGDATRELTVREVA